MGIEIPFFLKVILGIFLFQLALLWLALPFAIYGIKKRMQLAKEQRDEFLQEIFWLRKTVETIPGASGVARRHSQKFMQDLAERQKSSAEAEETDDGEKQDSGAVSAEKPAKKKQSGKKAVTAKKPAKKAAVKKAAVKKEAVKKSAEVNRDNEPQISVPRPAASLLEDDNFEGEDDPDDYDDEYDDEVPAPKKRAKKKAVSEEEHDDTADADDDSLDYLDDDTDPSHLLIDMPLKSSAKEKAQAMTNMVVEIPPEDEISENEDGTFVYRGEIYEHLLDAMKQQQDDAQKAKKAS